MLSIGESAGRFERREFLRIGGLGLGGLSLAQLLGAQALAGGENPLLKGRSVVFLFMHGGPSQIETFDPKMEAPTEIRSATGEVSTALPGITFGGTLPKLAKLADQFSIVRSFQTGDGQHNIKPIVCKDSFDANIGTLYSRIVGTNRLDNGMPTNVALFPKAVDPSTMPRISNFGKFESVGNFGSVYAPFIPGAGGEAQENLRLNLPLARLDDRRSLLQGLDVVKASLDAEPQLAGIDRVREQAFSTILGGVADAFDLSKEDAATIARYDTAPLMRPEDISRHWNNYERYVDNGKALGKLMLLARRLCEAGCGFVTVTTNFVWDMHSDVNNAGVEEGMRYMGLPFDHAVSAFLEDVADRGLSDRILLVCCGEMGRTPRINARGGRDHWGNLSPLLLAGGGIQPGQVVGQSTRDAAEPLTSPIRIPNLIATIMSTLFDVGALRLAQGVPPEIARAAGDWEPIPGLV
ncbi:DUF1501 domain-containing protein [bacterium]|nr:DUF1501 domain-containing protein [bacterium]